MMQIVQIISGVGVMPVIFAAPNWKRRLRCSIALHFRFQFLEIKLRGENVFIVIIVVVVVIIVIVVVVISVVVVVFVIFVIVVVIVIFMIVVVIVVIIVVIVVVIVIIVVVVKNLRFPESLCLHDRDNVVDFSFKGDLRIKNRKKNTSINALATQLSPAATVVDQRKRLRCFCVRALPL